MNKCIQCGSTNLEYLDTDREEIDESFEIERTIYRCNECGAKQMDVLEIETTYRPLGMKPFEDRRAK